jgi:hypothetical protein
VKEARACENALDVDLRQSGGNGEFIDVHAAIREPRGVVDLVGSCAELGSSDPSSTAASGVD